MRTHLELDCATEVCHHKAPRRTHFKSALPLLHDGLERLQGGPGAGLCTLRRGGEAQTQPRKARPKFLLLPPSANTWTHTHTHGHTHTQKKDPDSQRRKDMDVLKIAQNPLNLQTSEMVEVPCQETRPLPRNRQQGPSVKWPPGRAPSTVLLRTGRWHAVTGHSALAVACKKWTFRRWTEPRMLITATPPPKETTLYGTNKVGAGAGQAQGQIQ